VRQHERVWAQEGKCCSACKDVLTAVAASAAENRQTHPKLLAGLLVLGGVELGHVQALGLKLLGGGLVLCGTKVQERAQSTKVRQAA
jgi:hypothetical protein